MAFWPTFGTPPPTGGAGDVEGEVLEMGAGLPVERATVRATAYTGGREFTATPNSLGAYSMTLCADWYTMTAEAPGYHVAPQTRVAVLGGTLTTQDFRAEVVYPVYLPLVIKSES